MLSTLLVAARAWLAQIARAFGAALRGWLNHPVFYLLVVVAIALGLLGSHASWLAHRAASAEHAAFNSDLRAKQAEMTSAVKAATAAHSDVVRLEGDVRLAEQKASASEARRLQAEKNTALAVQASAALRADAATNTPASVQRLIAKMQADGYHPVASPCPR